MTEHCPFSAAGPARGSFIQPEVQANPYPLVQQLLQDRPITFDPISGAYVASRWKDIDHINSHPELFSSRIEFIFYRESSPLWPQMEQRYRERGFLPELALLAADPPVHPKQRALVDRAFSITNVRNLEPMIRELVDQQIDGFMAAREADLMHELAVPIPVGIIADQMGVAKEERHKLKLYGDVTMERQHPSIRPERELEIVDLIIEFQQFVRARAQHYEEHPDQSLLSRLVHAEVDGERLSPGTLVNIVHQLLIGGHETTTSAIGSACFMLVTQHDIRRRLASDSRLIPKFVEECLRLHPPGLMTFRVATRDTELHGVKLPQGALVISSLVCANYDPEQWREAEAMDLERSKPRNHMTFGRGIHFCIGNVLARTEVRIVLERLLTRLPELKLDQRRPPPQWDEVFNVHRLKELHVRF